MQSLSSSSFSSSRAGRALALCLGLGMFLAAAPAFASGGGGGGGGGAGGGGNGGGGSLNSFPPDQPQTSESAEPDLTTCPRGQIWSTKRKTCVRQRSEIFPDDALADYAYALAKSNRFDEAIEVLDTLKDPNTPKALNYRGYATRKLGRTDEGIGYYLRSVALDPQYAQVREYLGEAYVIKGRVDLAKDQLSTIKSLCGTSCEPYRDLSEAIEKAPKI